MFTTRNLKGSLSPKCIGIINLWYSKAFIPPKHWWRCWSQSSTINLWYSKAFIPVKHWWRCWSQSSDCSQWQGNDAWLDLDRYALGWERLTKGQIYCCSRSSCLGPQKGNGGIKSQYSKYTPTGQLYHQRSPNMGHLDPSSNRDSKTANK